MHSVSQICSSKDTLESEKIQNRPITGRQISGKELTNRVPSGRGWGVCLRVGWQSLLGAGRGGYICKIVRMRQWTSGATADGGPQGWCIASVYFSEIGEIDNNGRFGSAPPFSVIVFLALSLLVVLEWTQDPQMEALHRCWPCECVPPWQARGSWGPSVKCLCI